MGATLDFQAVLAILGMAAVAILAVVVGLRARARQRRSVREAAARMYADARSIYREEHEHRLVSPEDFPEIDRAGYQEHDAFLRGEGFRALAWIENLTVSRVYPEDRTYVAAHVSADQRTVASGWCLRGRQYLQLGCMTRDDRFLLTSNAEPNLQHWPATVDNCVLPIDTPLPDLLSRHRERVAAFDLREPSAEWHSFESTEAVVAALRISGRQQAKHRQSIGYITLSEMLALARNPAEEEAARRLWAEIKRQKEQEAG